MKRGTAALKSLCENSNLSIATRTPGRCLLDSKDATLKGGATKAPVSCLLTESLNGRARASYLCVFAALVSFMLVGCRPSAPAGAPSSGSSGAPSSATPGEKRYHLQGTVVQIDKAQQHLVIDHGDIPGFMAAMTMPYPVADAKTLDMVSVGDQVTADVVVTDTKVQLENVVVVKKADAGKPAPSTQVRPGDGIAVPNFALVNQDGKHIELAQYAGKTVLMTFIYTRCPLPDYCPLVTHNFAQI
jgi:protein SCO1